MIDEAALRTAMAQAVVAQLNPEVTAKLVTDAIITLMAPQRDTYGRPQNTPLQSAFEHEVRVVAEKQVKAFMAEPAQVEAIRVVVLKAWEKFMADGDKLQEAFAGAFWKLFDRKEY